MTIAAACAELTQLWPGLPTALTRDTTGAKGTQVTAGLVVNPDVLQAILTLHQEIPAATQTACHVVGEPWQPRPIPVCLTALPRLATRLHDTRHLADHAHLEDAARWWVRLTKRALGLRKPDMHLGRDCPYHDGPAQLVAPGPEGFLRHTRDGLVVEWEDAEVVYCPVCGYRWGASEWLLLGRMLRETA